MKAAVVTAYGEPAVVRVAERSQPQAGKGGIVVRAKAAAVTSADARIRAARFPKGFGLPARMAFGIRNPRRAVLGSAFSGMVEQVGAGVHGLNVGDEVCGMTGLSLGAHAELVAVDAGRVVAKPSLVSHDDAAGVLFGGTTALHFLRDKAQVLPGMSVLVNGASGAVGTNAVQLARAMGAQVTAVTSAANAALAAQLGAASVINYEREPLAELHRRFDVVLDTVGNLNIATARDLLTGGGVAVLAVATLGETLRARGNVVAGSAPERPSDFTELLARVAQGELSVIIDEIYSLDDIVEAHRRVDSQRKVGNILIHP